MIRNLIKRIKSLGTVNDSNTFQTVNGEVFGQNRKVSVLLPYGLLSSAPADSDGIVFQIMGQEENLVAILQDTKNRTKNLAEGECGLENTKTGTRIILKKNGDVDVDVAGDSNVNISGASNINVTGNVTLTAPLTTINGDVNVNGLATVGSLSVLGTFGGSTLSGTITNNATISGTGTVTSNGIQLDTHVHSGVQSGGSNTGGPL